MPAGALPQSSLRRLSLLAAAALVFAPLSAAPAQAESLKEACLAASPSGGIAICERAVEADPNDAASLRALGFAFLSLGEAEPSFAAYRRLLELAPEDWSAHFDAAAAYATFSRYDRAVAPALEAVRRNPAALAPNRLALLILQALRRDADAFPMLLKAAELGDDTAMVDLARAFERGEGIGADPRLALAWLERAAAADNALAIVRLAEVYEEGELGVAPDSAKAEAFARRAWLQRHFWDDEAAASNQ
ncbi:MAG: sel1 repeat family protein [Proteobacteria bacterium]|nr:sel1 repeat family protein [Pseudomonadota bacterium]MBI3495979.1 sel1 repeat family protein [Pseudomonadota bacterium]